MAPVPLASVRSLASLDGDAFQDDVEDVGDLEAELLSVPELCALLRSPEDQEREEALATLAEMVDGAFDGDGARLGHEVRASSGIPLLAWLLADPSIDVQMTALMVLANLCSDSVDYNSRLTKVALLPNARSVLSCAYTEDAQILLMACGALQNLTSEKDWAEVVVAHDVHLRLEQLVFHEDPRVVRYASGALQNVSRSSQLANLSELAHEAIRERSEQHSRESLVQQRARETLARALAKIPPRKRRERQDRGLHRRRLISRMDTESQCSSSTWSYEIGPFVRSRNTSRPSSACSHASHASSHSHASSYLTAKSSTLAVGE